MINVIIIVICTVSTLIMNDEFWDVWVCCVTPYNLLIFLKQCSELSFHTWWFWKILKPTNTKIILRYETCIPPHIYRFKKFLTYKIKSPHGIVSKELDSHIIVSDFEFQSSYNVYFKTNTHGKGMNSLFPLLWATQYHYCFFFLQD